MFYTFIITGISLMLYILDDIPYFIIYKAYPQWSGLSKSHDSAEHIIDKNFC